MVPVSISLSLSLYFLGIFNRLSVVFFFSFSLSPTAYMEYIKAKMVILSLRRGAVINPAQQRRTLWAFVFYYHLSYCARMGLYIYLYTHPPLLVLKRTTKELIN
jgi:hypothetical protein